MTLRFLSARSYWAAIILTVFLLGFVISIAGISPAQNNEVVFKKDVRFSDLPPGIEKRAVPDATPEQIREMLTAQPSIVIDGATLYVTAQSAGVGRSLAVRNLELRNGGRIVTNGINLEVSALLVSSDKGEILSFNPEIQHVSGAASDGTSGQSGLSGGTVVLSGALKDNEILTVYLPGQDGQAGGRGLVGPDGAPGARGSNAVDSAFSCAHGGGDGGSGAAGGPGGTGGAGGAGGSGGNVILRRALASQRSQMRISAPGGKGGAGGLPGPGGRGGPGGVGGSGSAFCGGGRAGPVGAGGREGAPGAKGPNGKNGSIRVD